VWSVFLCHGLELGFEYAKTAPPSSVTAGGGAVVFIRCNYLPAMRTGLYATPNPAAIKRSILTLSKTQLQCHYPSSEKPWILIDVSFGTPKLTSINEKRQKTPYF
jgi:hypothetical protein